MWSSLNFRKQQTEGGSKSGHPAHPPSDPVPRSRGGRGIGAQGMIGGSGVYHKQKSRNQNSATAIHTCYSTKPQNTGERVLLAHDPTL